MSDYCASCAYRDKEADELIRRLDVAETQWKLHQEELFDTKRLAEDLLDWLAHIQVFMKGPPSFEVVTGQGAWNELLAKARSLRAAIAQAEERNSIMTEPKRDGMLVAEMAALVRKKQAAYRMLAADAMYDVLSDVRPIIVALKSAYEDVLGEAYDGYLDAIDNALAQADGKWEDEL